MILETLFRNEKLQPVVSIILLDWSSRENLHSLDYLNNQTISRGLYEVIWVEYYQKRSPAIAAKLEGCIQCQRNYFVQR